MLRTRRIPLYLLLLSLVTACASRPSSPEAAVVQKINNPLLTGDHPDPQLFWNDGAFWLTYTGGTQVFVRSSPDLVRWSEPRPIFSTPEGGNGNRPLVINGRGFCNVWAPEFFPHKDRTWLLFSATAVPENTPSCPGFDGSLGLYATSSVHGMEGGFAVETSEPRPIGENAECKGPYPHSRPGPTCDGNCENSPRLDGSYFRQGERLFFAYSWFTNPVPHTEWEKKNHGVHVSVMEMSSTDPTTSFCNGNPLFSLSPGDRELERQLAKSCPECHRYMSFSKDAGNQRLQWNGKPGGILEGASLFQRGDYVYLLFSHSGFHSAHYSVAWIAAKSVAGLGGKDRIMGRYLIPSGSYAFGHGSPLKLGESWFYVYHRIDHDQCLKQLGRKCERDVFMSPMEFEDRGDGKGAVYLKARFPETDSEVFLKP